MNEQITLTRTYFRTIAFLLLFLILCFVYRSYIHPVTELSMVTILQHKYASAFLTTGLVADLLFFSLTFLIVHLIWALIITISCKSFFTKTADDTLKTKFWLMIIFVHFNFVLLANSYLYPTSVVSIYRLSILSQPIIITVLGLIIAYFFIKGLLIDKQWKKMLVAISLLIWCLTPPIYQIDKFDNSTTNKPNIILIGLDALRPDHLSYKQQQVDYTPFLNTFLEQSIIYDKSYTTLPRTFVSWFSLLKSQYPNTHDGRFNLTPAELINKDIELLKQLKRQGYTTTFALDERRFNHIDESYGFDNAIGPKIGFADQLTNRVADIPILNLLSHTRFGRYLLPFMFINRGNGKTYNSELFINESLNALNANTPNFLSIHFCMLHWPYTSKEFINVDPKKWQGNHNHFLYLSLLEKLDKQFETVITKLKNNGYLDNALVFVFSDHGDGFNMEKYKLSPQKTEFEGLPIKVNSWGHATNVLDQTQANILLAFSHYKDGKLINKNQIITGNFSIIDIVPSIYKKLGFKQNEQFQGIPLPNNNLQVNSERVLFVNSSKPSKLLDTSFIKTDKVLYENLGNYTVAKNGFFELKKTAYKDFIKMQHRSIYYKDWQLAFIPEYKGFILVDIKKRQWLPIGKNEEDVKAPINHMKKLFCEHYARDTLFDDSEICHKTYITKNN
ncbi:sulfatase-like hydrolase/transferase [Thalassotalea fonticola]|uniref:Sulfatase-like hydrolase/transferase n=1 Tax=Thalassotalea fonticola TaxID=3065649 RepID=A0ABZ0GTD2_9GAMM|nr:sulfatase-like hydrolase/transferase [Colwelliaceae bacterium S1-1]